MPLPVTVSPSLGDYSVPASLSGVPALDCADIDAAGRAVLAKNLFFLRPSGDAQIYDIYKDVKNPVPRSS